MQISQLFLTSRQCLFDQLFSSVKSDSKYNEIDLTAKENKFSFLHFLEEKKPVQQKKMYKKFHLIISAFSPFLNLNKYLTLHQIAPCLRFKFNLIFILIISFNELPLIAGIASPIVFHQAFELVIEPEPEPESKDTSRPSWMNGICVNVTEVEPGTFQALG